MILKPLKLHYSSKYPYKVQAESDYTYVDLNNEVHLRIFPRRHNQLQIDHGVVLMIFIIII
jgi:hypothetical protein